LAALFGEFAEDFLAGLDGFALALDGGLLEVLPLAQLGKNPRLLDLALEAAESVLEALFLAHVDDGHLLDHLSSLLQDFKAGSQQGHRARILSRAASEVKEDALSLDAGYFELPAGLPPAASRKH
jgi:hypothetical protein